MKYEHEKGMTSIYRNLRKKCRSSTLRRYLTTLILVVALMVPAGVYANWTGVIQSEKPAGQAFEAGWADVNGDLSLLQIQFIGNGVVHLVASDAGTIFSDKTVHGTARFTVDGAQVTLEDCDHALLSCQNVAIFSAPSGSLINVDLKGAFNGAFQKTDLSVVAGSQRGTLTFELTLAD
jgi:hypothetical protein